MRSGDRNAGTLQIALTLKKSGKSGVVIVRAIGKTAGQEYAYAKATEIGNRNFQGEEKVKEIVRFIEACDKFVVTLDKYPNGAIRFVRVLLICLLGLVVFGLTVTWLNFGLEAVL
jgi:hypothetical protein